MFKHSEADIEGKLVNRKDILPKIVKINFTIIVTKYF